MGKSKKRTHSDMQILAPAPSANLPESEVKTWLGAKQSARAQAWEVQMPQGQRCSVAALQS